MQDFRIGFPRQNRRLPPGWNPLKGKGSPGTKQSSPMSIMVLASIIILSLHYCKAVSTAATAKQCGQSARPYHLVSSCTFNQLALHHIWTFTDVTTRLP